MCDAWKPSDTATSFALVFGVLSEQTAAGLLISRKGWRTVRVSLIFITRY
jgi:hypothetical protein